MADNDDKPLLTLGKVREWQATRNKNAERIDDLQNENATLDRKLAAAAEIMQDVEETPKKQPIALHRGPNGSADLLPMTDAVEAIVSRSVHPLFSKQVKELLAEAGYPKKRLGNYFYTVMRRLTEHNRIVREGDTFVAPEPEPSLLETSEAPNDHG